MTVPTFKIYSSSAGSGKTYTLTKEYLKLALKSDSAYYFKRILAITFTNDAANEMKERILKALRHFAYPNELSLKEKAQSDDLLRQLLEEMSHTELQQPVTEEIIRQRAGQTFRKIIHEYSDFSVSTIDSFVNRIVSAFTEELNIPFNYEVDMDTQTLLNNAVDRLLDKAGRVEFSQLSEALELYALEKAGEGKNWNNLPAELADFARNLLNEQVFASVSKIKHLTPRDFKDIREKLRSHNAKVEALIIQHATKAMACLVSQDLTAKEFFQTSSGIIGYFAKRVEGNGLFDAPNSYVVKTMEEDKWYGGKATQSQKAAIDSVKSELMDLFVEIETIRHEAGHKYLLYKQLLPHFYKLSVLNQLKEELKEIQREKNTIHISDFNKAILDIVLREPVPFIYERLGEKYNHILVDEFQDTSVLQWTNLLPLIENSLGNAHFNLAVGDAKQAIYRWRGGEMEQIVHLYKEQPELLLPRGGEHLDMMIERYQSIAPYLTPSRLSINYRSHREIIAFNNELFRTIADSYGHQNPLLAAIYDEGFEQEIPENAKNGGHVQIQFIDQETKGAEIKASYDEVMLQNVWQLIQEAQRAGYDLKDIAILNRRNHQGKIIASFLKERGIEIISQDSLSLQFSETVNLLTSLLKVIQAPDHTLAKYEALYLFYRLIKNEIPDSDTNEKIRAVVESEDVQNFYDHLESEGYFLEAFRLQQLSIYEICEKLIHLFRLFDRARQTEYLFRFLDVVLEYSNRQSNQLADFLAYWELKKDSLSINSPKNRNAVTLTSVHKSKGLEYPVVIVPFADWSLFPQNNASMWIDLEELEFDELNTLSDNGEEAVEKKLLATSVAISSALQNTPLQEQHTRELDRTFIESLNMLYVALTRPTDRLYILSKATEYGDRRNQKNVGYLLYQYLQIKGLWQEETANYVLSEGIERVGASENKQLDTIFELNEIICHDKSGNARLNRTASRLFDLDTFEKNKDWGNKFYDVMIRVKYAKDVDRSVRSLFNEGLLNREEADRLKESIEVLLAHPDLSPLFVEGLRVENNKEILMRGGEALVPDRVVWQGAKVTILDYKTGFTDPRHREPMEKYARLFSQLGFQRIECLLVYLEEGVVIKV